MSGGEACKNPLHRAWWWVSEYQQNHSAFNGYHPTFSDYSEVRCAAPRGLGTCAKSDTDPGAINGRVWRTKAHYVDSLPLAEPIDFFDWKAGTR